MELAFSRLEEALSALGQLLDARGTRYDVVVVGGGNLILRNLISRPTTKDIDLLGLLGPGGVQRVDRMPEGLAVAVTDVARAFGLSSDWINLGPASLIDLGLPDGFVDRLERRDFGGVVVWFAGRFDMICFKLYAAVDSDRRSRHFQDLQDLSPTPGELRQAARWTQTHDVSPAYRTTLGAVLDALGVRDFDDALE